MSPAGGGASGKGSLWSFWLLLLDPVCVSFGVALSGAGPGSASCSIFRVVSVHSLHVVHQIVVARESIAGQRAFTSIKLAQIWFVPMPVQSVCLSLMTKQTRCGRESVLILCTPASILLTDKWLEVGVNVFAIEIVSNHIFPLFPLKLTRSCT